MESTVYPQSCSEPNESAQQPLTVPSSSMNNKIPKASWNEDCSLPSPPMKTNRIIPMQTKSVLVSRDTGNVAALPTSATKSSSGFKYKLEMPTLRAPSWRTKKDRSTNSDDSNVTMLSTPSPPPTPCLKASSAFTKSSLSMPQFQFPKASNRDSVCGSFEVQANPHKQAKTHRISSLESKCTQSASMPSKTPGAVQKNTVLNLPTKSGILSGRSVLPQSGNFTGASPELPVGSSSNDGMPPDFRFKVPKLPVGKDELNNVTQIVKSRTLDKSVPNSHAAGPEETEPVGNTLDVGSDSQNRMEWTS